MFSAADDGDLTIQGTASASGAVTVGTSAPDYWHCFDGDGGTCLEFQVGDDPLATPFTLFVGPTYDSSQYSDWIAYCSSWAANGGTYRGGKGQCDGTTTTLSQTTGTPIRINTDKFTVLASGNTDVEGALTVTGAAALGSSLAISGDITASRWNGDTNEGTAFSASSTTGNTVVEGALTAEAGMSITGTTLLGHTGGGSLVVKDGVTTKFSVAGDTGATTMGAVSISSDLTVGGTAFTVTESSGAAVAGGDLDVTLGTTMAGTVTLKNNANLEGTLTVGSPSTKFSVAHDTGAVQVDGDLSITGSVTLDSSGTGTLIVDTPQTVSTRTDACTTGQIAYDTTRLFICVDSSSGTMKWKEIALSGW